MKTNIPTLTAIDTIRCTPISSLWKQPRIFPFEGSTVIGRYTWTTSNGRKF